jgi:hypothetical protein
VTAASEPSYTFHTGQNKNGTPIYWFANHENFSIYCYVESENYFRDFHVDGRDVSRANYLPSGDIFYGCE